MKKASKSLVVLTAALEPKQVPFLVRADHALRRRDYTVAMKHYASTLPADTFTLAVVENTGSDVDDLRTIASKFGHSLKTLCYTEEAAVQQRGKGNAEAKMFDAVSSVFLQEDSPYDRVIKITGRLVVRNIDRVLRVHHPERFIAARMSFDRRQLDTRLLMTDVQTWKDFFSGQDSQVDEAAGVFLEHVAALRTAEAIFAGARWCQLRPKPHFAGYSGSTGYKYGSRRDRILDGISGISGRLLQKHYI